MKKYLRYADVFVLFAGALGLLLRLLVLMGGTDDKALYPAAHPAWIILCVISVPVLLAIWLVTRNVGNDDRYAVNFPRSIPGAVACALAAVALLVTALDFWKLSPNAGRLLHMVCGLLGMGSAAGLGLAAYCRFVGKKPHYACLFLPCAFFTLRIFLLGQTLGAEPETVRYLFKMLAGLAMIPACYQLWGFTVDLGNRSKCLFWCLTAAFLSMVAVPDTDGWLLHIACAAWMMTHICPLRVLRKPVCVPQPEEAPAEASAESEEPAPEAAESVEEIDVDAILADILKEMDQK